jgi:hypothetical protein
MGLIAAEELGGRLVGFFVVLTDETEHGGEGLESLILADYSLCVCIMPGDCGENVAAFPLSS